MAKPMAFADLMALIDRDPIAGAVAMQRFSDGTRIRTYQGSVAAYKVAMALKDNQALRTAFYSLPMWAKGYTKNVSHLLLHCHQQAYKARDGRDGRLAEDHARATQSTFDEGITTAEELFEKLKKEGGFDGLKKAAAAARDGAEADIPPSESDDGSAGKPPAAALKNDEHAAEKKAGRPPRNIFWSASELAKRLLVDMPPEELDLFLPTNSHRGDEALLRIIRMPDAENGMAVWKAIKIDFTPRKSE